MKKRLLNPRDFLIDAAAVALAMPIGAQAATDYRPELPKAEDPAYETAFSFGNVDRDLWGKGALVAQLNIPRRSMLVLLKGDRLLGRIVAGPAKAEIKALTDLALQAATA